MRETPETKKTKIIGKSVSTPEDADALLVYLEEQRLKLYADATEEIKALEEKIEAVLERVKAEDEIILKKTGARLNLALIGKFEILEIFNVTNRFVKNMKKAREEIADYAERCKTTV